MRIPADVSTDIFTDPEIIEHKIGPSCQTMFMCIIHLDNFTSDASLTTEEIESKYIGSLEYLGLRDIAHPDEAKEYPRLPSQCFHRNKQVFRL